ncbi:MAG: leucine-rich repeat domain-containing protein, partial [Treponema sp.]|nr:leucine-rich repeat domain-containing protein [Treponema sp.]
AVSDNKIGEYAFARCSKLNSVILPSSVTEIGRQAFCNTGLKKVEIPEGVIKLCRDCFGSCSSLEKVTIASTVTTMSHGVFWSCPKITDAYVKPLKPPTLGAYIFGKKPVIHVKAEAVAAYNESKWKDFGEIVGDLE